MISCVKKVSSPFCHCHFHFGIPESQFPFLSLPFSFRNTGKSVPPSVIAIFIYRVLIWLVFQFFSWRNRVETVFRDFRCSGIWSCSVVVLRRYLKFRWELFVFVYNILLFSLHSSSNNNIDNTLYFATYPLTAVSESDVLTSSS